MEFYTKIKSMFELPAIMQIFKGVADSVVSRKRFSCVWSIPQPPQVVETSCSIKGVMCTRKGMHKECNKLVVTQLTRAHMGYIGLCGTRACVTTI